MAKLSSTDIYGDLYVDGIISGALSGNATTATTASKLGTNAGSTTQPVYFSNGIPVAGLSYFTKSSVGDIGWGSSNNNSPVTVSGIAYWNGAYSGTASNLTYCSKGAFGTIVTKNSGDYATASHTHSSITATTGSSWTGTAVPNATDCLINFYSHISKSATGLFTTGDNSNAIISINRHQGNYDSQLGFSSQGGIFYRYVDGTAMTDSTTWYRVYTSLNKPTPADIGAATSDHTHNYAGSSSAGGAANSVKTNLVVKLNGGGTEGTNLFTFNGSAAKTINITPSAIGAAASSHGTHLTIGTGSSNAAAGNHTHTNIVNQDTRAVNTTPDDAPLGLSVHLKANGTDSLSDGGSYHSSLFIKGWNDYSGGPYGNIAISANNNLWYRASSSGTAWNSWKKVSVDGHTHNYAGSSSAGGAANNSDKVGGYSVWVGTQTQYDAISSKSSTTIYYITG